MTIYIAGPLYTRGDRFYLELVDSICKESGFFTYLPHRDSGLAPADGSVTLPYFEGDICALNNASIIVAILNGSDVDSGTAWEMGYGYAQGKKIIGIFDDTRISNPKANFNLMITSSSEIVDSLDQLKKRLINIKSLE